MHDLFRISAARHRTVLMSWHALGSPLAIEAAGRAGWQAVLIDLQHGVADQRDWLACLIAAQAIGRPALVRVAQKNSEAIGQVLDAGAQGVVCPMINTAKEAANFVAAVKYPPLGNRSYGPYRARPMYGDDYLKDANGWTIACAQIETQKALDHLDEILQVEGLDMILIGPNDLAISMTNGDSKDIYQPEVTYALDRILQRAREHKVIAGIFANDSDYAKSLIQKSWDVVSVGTDLTHMTQGFRQSFSYLTALSLR